MDVTENDSVLVLLVSLLIYLIYGQSVLMDTNHWIHERVVRMNAESVRLLATVNGIGMESDHLRETTVDLSGLDETWKEGILRQLRNADEQTRRDWNTVKQRMLDHTLITMALIKRSKPGIILFTEPSPRMKSRILFDQTMSPLREALVRSFNLYIGTWDDRLRSRRCTVNIIRMAEGKGPKEMRELVRKLVEKDEKHSHRINLVL